MNVDSQNRRLTSSAGFTLIEIIIVIIVLGIVASVAIPRFGDMAESAKETATKDELARLKTAIIGDARVTSGGSYVQRGYLGDVGAVPSSLTDLVTIPAAAPVYDKFTRIGWNGPYIDSADGEYLTDSWGVAYSYNSVARTITSTGGSASIVVSF